VDSHHGRQNNSSTTLTRSSLWIAPLGIDDIVAALDDAPGVTLANADTDAEARAEMLRLEIFVNNLRYASRVPMTLPGEPWELPHPLWCAIVPLREPYSVEIFGVRGDAHVERVRRLLLRTLRLPNGTAQPVALVPVHWEQAQLLATARPDIPLATFGTVFRTSSPRTVVVGPTRRSLAAALPGIESYAMKLHLPPESEPIAGGLGGHRFVTRNDALLATVTSHRSRTGLLIVHFSG
jgi:hypothetical protein